MRKRKALVRLLATVLLGSLLSGCQPREAIGPLDVVYTNEKEDITIRALFEGSDESLRYAKYLDVTGKCSNEKNPGGDKTKIDFEFESYNSDDNNYVDVWTGTYSKESIASIFESSFGTEAEYCYYKGMKDGQEVDGFHAEVIKKNGFAIDESRINIAVKRIILPDFSKLDLTKVWIEFDGSIDNNGCYEVVLTGDLRYFNGCFGNMEGSKGIRSVRYFFSAETHVLEKVEVEGLIQDTMELGPTNKQIEEKCVLEADFFIKEVSYKDQGVVYPTFE